ncbi:carboxypeptidase regulatory-like domain-containing protein [Bremerella cremea]|uniref:Carboxypeptidase regulatory-like domain-containing protein n=1 Tax=Bremerella cremea TaxID=1031537 RepID=A0A368KJW7_9BACT|nr:carboxypeptidase regulatory-like domain-containing protein [Bremerella cremea]RCS41061.1 carboxypeptidase regulatory-like domain-containing protein [Bremerella cremea]
MNRYGLMPIVLGLACVIGCNSESSTKVPGRSVTVEAGGIVTLNGKPLAGATVLFSSEQLNLTAYAKTDKAGRFQLSTYEPGDGAPAGHYRVAIKKVDHAVTSPSDHPALPPTTESSPLLPAKYADCETSDLEAVVAEGKDNSFTFQLFDLLETS